MGVTKYAFAIDLKDAGVDFPLAEVAGYCVTCAVITYRTHLYLKDKKMSTFKPIEKITLLEGTAFFTGAGKGITDAIAAFDK